MLKLYNTLSGKIEVFTPRQKKKVKMFVCGPTVYDYAHLGHSRTYVIFDMFVNYLTHLGFDVFYLQNITDVDDKIIQRAKEKNISPKILAKQFEKEYMADMKTLQIKSVKKYARATQHIKEIISQVERLLAKGFAYKTTDGIYYDVSKFKPYGKLSKRIGHIAEASFSRIDESVAKKDKADFCLWKYAKSENAPSHHLLQEGATQYEPSWPSPWGKGRPGWHIEDTAITEKYFGPQYDIHGGARDLIFPHHEAEISQMEAISGKSPFVKYWMHTGFLTVNGQKMSKSLGNFITIRDFLKTNSASLLRFLIFSSHYRSPIDFQESSVKQAKASLEKIQDFAQQINLMTYSPKSKSLVSKHQRLPFIKQNISDFWRALENDFNTPKAKAALFKMINRANEKISQNQLSINDAKTIWNFLQDINKIFLFLDLQKKSPKQLIPPKVLLLVEQREKYRKTQNWQKADQIRQEIANLGFAIKDTANGPIINKVLSKRSQE